MFPRIVGLLIPSPGVENALCSRFAGRKAPRSFHGSLSDVRLYRISGGHSYGRKSGHPESSRTSTNERRQNRPFTGLYSQKELYAIYRMWCEENALVPLKARSFSDYLVENEKKYNLEHNNKVTNAAGRRVWGFWGIEALVKPNINENMGDSLHTYVPEWQE